MKKLVLGGVALAILVGATSAVMAIGGQPSSELDALRTRVARLEAKEEVLSAFNQYLYGIDTGFKDDILDIFAEDAVLDVPNFPPANEDLHFEGREALAPLYSMYSRRPPHIGGGHHTANLAVNVRPGLTHADLSSYFMTSGQGGVQGGRYEGVMRKEADGKWRWESLTITSAWGFRAEHFDTVSESVSAEKYSPRGGHHAAYQPAP